VNRASRADNQREKGTAADPYFTTATGLPLFGVDLHRFVMLFHA